MPITLPTPGELVSRLRSRFSPSAMTPVIPSAPRPQLPDTATAVDIVRALDAAPLVLRIAGPDVHGLADLLVPADSSAARGAQPAPTPAPPIMADAVSTIENELAGFQAVYTLVPRILAIITAARQVNGLAGWLAVALRAPQAVAAVVPLVEQMLGVAPPA